MASVNSLSEIKKYLAQYYPHIANLIKGADEDAIYAILYGALSIDASDDGYSIALELAKYLPDEIVEEKSDYTTSLKVVGDYSTYEKLETLSKNSKEYKKYLDKIDGWNKPDIYIDVNKNTLQYSLVNTKEKDGKYTVTSQSKTEATTTDRDLVTNTKTQNKFNRESDTAEIKDFISEYDTRQQEDTLKKCLETMTEFIDKKSNAQPYMRLEFNPISNYIYDTSVHDTVEVKKDKGKKNKKSKKKQKDAGITQTSDGAVLVMDSRDANSPVVTSFQYKRGTEGNANEFTFTIAFAPQSETQTINVLNGLNDVDSSKYSYVTPNSFEQLLIKSCYGEKDGKIYNAQLEFGYTYTDEENYTRLIKSPKYRAFIIDYNVEMQNNMLIYNVNGTSACVNDDNAISIYRPAFNGSVFPIEAIGDVIKVYGDSENIKLASGYMPDGTKIFNFNKKDDKYHINCEIIKNFRDRFKYAKDHKKDVLHNSIDTKLDNEENENDATNKYEQLSEKGLPQSSGKMSLFTVVDDLLSYSLLRKKYLTQGDEYKGSFYRETIDIMTKNNDSLSIIAIKFMPDHDIDHKFSEKDCWAIFNWGDQPNTGGMVINFRPELKGSVIKAMELSDEIGIKYLDNLYWTDNDGINHRLFDATDETLQSGEMAIWQQIYKEEATNAMLESKAYYMATMQVQGIPKEIPLCSYIKVNSYMNGQRHHSSGIYMVTGVTDQLGSNGFMTSLNLIKMESKDIPTQQELINKVNNIIKKNYPELHKDVEIIEPKNVPDTYTAAVGIDKKTWDTIQKEKKEAKKNANTISTTPAREQLIKSKNPIGYNNPAFDNDNVIATTNSSVTQ